MRGGGLPRGTTAAKEEEDQRASQIVHKHTSEAALPGAIPRSISESSLDEPGSKMGSFQRVTLPRPSFDMPRTQTPERRPLA